MGISSSFSFRDLRYAPFICSFSLALLTITNFSLFEIWSSFRFSKTFKRKYWTSFDNVEANERASVLVRLLLIQNIKRLVCFSFLFMAVVEIKMFNSWIKS